VIDIVPTILEVAGLSEPVQVHGVTQKPIEGVSMAYTFDDAKAKDRHTTQYFELWGNRGIYHDGWSAITAHLVPTAASPTPWNEDRWELYDGATDWSQAKDLAAEQPEKLAELKDLFLIEAARYNVFSMDDRRSQRMNPAYAGRRDLMGGRKTWTLYPGMRSIGENAAINVKNNSHTVSADLVVPEGGANGTPVSGVIVAQGGRFGGWSLYVLDGKLKYCHNFLYLARYPVAAPDLLPAGDVKVQYKFKYDDGETGAGGTGELFVNGKKVAEARIDKTVPFSFSADETLDVGVDLATPVTDDYPMGKCNAFTGTIKSVTIALDTNATAYVEPEENLIARLMASQ